MPPLRAAESKVRKLVGRRRGQNKYFTGKFLFFALNEL
jgi:hypothetical protein